MSAALETYSQCCAAACKTSSQPRAAQAGTALERRFSTSWKHRGLATVSKAHLEIQTKLQPTLSTAGPSGRCYLPQIFLQEGNLPVVPSLPGPVVGETQQPRVELIANGWPETLLISLYHLERERESTKVNLGVELGGQFAGQGLLLTPSCW